MMRCSLLLVLVAAGCGGPLAPDAGGVDIGGPDLGGPDLVPGPLALAPGAVVELNVKAGQTGARLPTPAGTEQYVVILGSMLLDGSGQTFNYTFTLGGAPAPARATPVDGCSLPTDPWPKAMLPVETPPSGAAPAMGATRMLKVSVGAGAQAIQAQVIAVSPHAVVWSDVTPAHPSMLDMAFVNQFIDDFEKIILPRERELFGMESDLDGDGRIGLVFTPLTAQTAVAFFTGCDLQKLAGCPDGNHGEFLYLTPPSAIKPPYNTPKAIKEIIAHEFSHLIHFNRKVLRNHLQDWPDSSYMIEGVGALAQDIIGYQAGNLYVTKAGLDQIEDYALGDTLVDYTPYDPAHDGGLRGGSYLLVRWLYDRGGGDALQPDGTVLAKGGPQLLRALLDGKTSMATLLPPLVKATEADLGMDFLTTLAMSNRGDNHQAPPENPCFSYLPPVTDPATMDQRGANLFAQFHTMMMNGPAVQDGHSPDGDLLAGGVEFLELDAVAGKAEIAVALKADPASLPRVRVGRWK